MTEAQGGMPARREDRHAPATADDQPAAVVASARVLWDINFNAAGDVRLGDDARSGIRPW
jgi:hypothetical protein